MCKSPTNTNIGYRLQAYTYQLSIQTHAIANARYK